MSYDLGTAHGTIELEYKGHGAADAAAKDIEDVSKKSKDGDKDLKKFVSTLKDFSAVAGKKIALGTVFSEAAVGAGSLLINILGIIPQLASILSLSAAIPGAITGIVASVLVLHAAFNGVGDALKLAFDPKKAAQFNEALKQLSPSAAAFVSAIHKLAPEFQAYGKGIQEAFFSTANLTGLLPRVQSVMAALGGQLRGLSSDFGAVTKDVANFAVSAKSTQFVTDAIAQFRGALLLVTPSIVPILEGLREVGKIGLPLLGRLGGEVGWVATQFADWLNKISSNGQLQTWINTALTTLATLGGVVKNVGSIFFSVISAAQSVGGGLLGTLEGITGQLADFLKSADGIATLQGIFSAILSAAKPLAPILTTAASAIVKALGPAIEQVTSALGPALLQTVQTLAPALGPLATALANLIVAVVPLLPALAPLVPIIANIAASVIGALTPALAGISKFLVQNTGFVKGLAVALTVLGGVMLTSSAIAGVQAAGGLLKYLASTKLVTAATKVWTAVQAVFNAVMDANPITLVVIAVAALVAGIILAYKHSETFRKIVNGLWAGIVAVAKAIGGAFVTAFKTVANLFASLPALFGKIGDFFARLPGLALSGIKSLGSAIGNLVTTVGGAIVNFFTALPGRLLAALRALPGLLLGIIKAALIAIVTAVAFNIGLVVAIFTKLPGLIIAKIKQLAPIVGGALKDAWNAAYSATVNGTAAVINFAKSLPGRIKNAIIAAVSFIGSTLSAAWHAAYVATVNGIVATISFARSLPGRIRSAISALGSFIRNVAVSAWNGFRSAVVNGVNATISFVKGLPGRIRSALGNVGSMLYNSGKAIINGLWNGLQSSASRVLNFIKDLANRAKDAFNSALNIFSPSRDFFDSGQYIGEGLINGLKDKMADVARTAQALANTVIQPTLQLPTAATMAINSIPALPAARAEAASALDGGRDLGPYELKVDQGTLTRFTIDAVTGAPKEVANAANEGNRKNQFAGSGRKQGS